MRKNNFLKQNQLSNVMEYLLGRYHCSGLQGGWESREFSTACLFNGGEEIKTQNESH